VPRGSHLATGSLHTQESTIHTKRLVAQQNVFTLLLHTRHQIKSMQRKII